MEIIKQNIYDERMRRISEFGSIADLSFEAGAMWGMAHADDATRPPKSPDDKKVIYLIGSLKNKKIPLIAKQLREELGFEVFDDWFSPGPEADDFWRDYEKTRGSTHKQALSNYAGRHIYEFDKHHIDCADIGVLIMPAGKSGHLELGYMIGQGKPCFILFEEEPERWDIMHIFSKENGGDIYYSFDELKMELQKLK
jgi:nucleoside 2-deoxyribosyltransferase